ncbi:Type 1 glutamine amidotransferase-like domain-containing protein [Marininema halotolerans]|uniref:Dipeptidase E n=1 Tax=Marininema halotolerans TaxID=1155944 RepID=A0A1I6R3E8_9BACL|nr:Type 1 glutamine amidotransferase-like domain-containing protein [Marininema halotolerans]SFS59271.1 dipeptidase E [Marininema halotolerans]
MQKKLVLIGGGWMRDGDTEEVDSFAVQLTNKPSPLALFVPTASRDEEAYIEGFRDVYGWKLGCRTEVLRSFDWELDEKTIREKILGADLIYLGGGNYVTMLSLWKKQGLDRTILEAWERGVVLVGISAGAICWFNKGMRSHYEEKGIS